MRRLSALAVCATATVAVLVAQAGAAEQSRACSLDDRGQIRPSELRTGVRTTMLPAGAVSLTVCRYNGANAFHGAPQFALLGAGVTSDRSRIDKLTDGLDALKPTHGVYNCPMDDGSQDVATFVYPSGPSVVITVGTDGCLVISNGHVVRMGIGAGSAVVSNVSALAKPVKGLKWPTVSGYIRLCGGPSPGGCRPGTIAASRVLAVNAGDTWVAMGQLHKGRFRFQVATPGAYTIKLMGPGKRFNDVLAKRTTTLTAGRTTSVALTVDVP